MTSLVVHFSLHYDTLLAQHPGALDTPGMITFTFSKLCPLDGGGLTPSR